MIRHYDKFDELVTFPVKMLQTGFHDRLAIWACQDAASVTSSWLGFHHHLVMSAIAYLFILTTYLAAKKLLG